jgi:Amt family ammonium transporter
VITTPLENWESILRVWWAVSGMLVLLMQVGFTYLEMGCVKAVDRPGIAIKNLTMLLVSTLAFLTFGKQIMYGDSDSFVYGWEGIAANVTGIHGAYEWVFLQAGFAAVAATIVSGALAGRTTLFSNVVIAFIVGGILFPVYGHWVWGTGLLNTDLVKVYDFAGSSTVHFLGGVVALLGAKFAGVRNADEKEELDLRFATVGVVFLWIGWIGFNGGSVTLDQLIARQSFAPIGEAVMATTLAACVGGLTVMLLAGFCEWMFFDGKELSLPECFRLEMLFRPIDVLTGIMGGMVAVTASCDQVQGDYRGAVMIGALGGISAFAVTHLLSPRGRSEPIVDDPVGAVPVHAGAGAMGILLGGFFLEPELVDQILGLVLAAFVAVTGTVGVFWLLRRFDLLRVGYARERKGLTFAPLGTDGLGADTMRDLWKNSSGDPLFSPRPPVRVSGEGDLRPKIASFMSEAFEVNGERDARFYIWCCAESEEERAVWSIENGREEARLATVIVASHVRRVARMLRDAGLGYVPVIKAADGWPFGLVEQVTQLRRRGNLSDYEKRTNGGGSSGGRILSSRPAVAIGSIVTSIIGALLTGLISQAQIGPAKGGSATWIALGTSLEEPVMFLAGPQRYYVHQDRRRDNWWLTESTDPASRADPIQGGRILWNDSDDQSLGGRWLDFMTGGVYSFGYSGDGFSLDELEPSREPRRLLAGTTTWQQ